MLYRISKYDFSADLNLQWTSVWDINTDKYNLTAEEYLYWENIYTTCAKDIIDLTEDKLFVIKGIEYHEVEFPKKNIANKKTVYEMISDDRNTPVFTELINGNRLFWKEKINDLMRILLREEMWFKIVGKTISIDTGYDYYVHFDCNINIPDSIIKKYSNLNFEYFDKREKKYKFYI